jgi:hypothetical protein
MEKLLEIALDYISAPLSCLYNQSVAVRAFLAFYA